MKIYQINVFKAKNQTYQKNLEFNEFARPAKIV
jgi:hypothetical protein